MSQQQPQQRRGPPPPPPASHYGGHQAPILSVSSESEEETGIEPVKTDLVLNMNASIDARFHHSARFGYQVVVFLDVLTILQTGLSPHLNLSRSKRDYFDAVLIRGLVIDKLNNPRPRTESKGGTFIAVPSQDLLWNIEQATKVALEECIAYCSERENQGTPEMRKDCSVAKETMKYALLHGEQCLIWKGQKEIGRGRLSFSSLSEFSIQNGKARYFDCTDRDFLSGKFRIEKEGREETEQKGLAAGA